MQILSLIKFFFISAATLLFFVNSLFAAQLTLSNKIDWTIYSNYTISNSTYPNFITFYGATFHKSKFGNLPLFSLSQIINNEEDTKVFLKNEIYESIDRTIKIQDQVLITSVNSVDVLYYTGYEKGVPKLVIQFLPIRFNSGTGLYEKLVSFDIVITYKDGSSIQSQLGKKAFTTNSVLAQGEWYKIGVTSTGVHKIDSQFFAKNKIDISSVDPKTIKIYGNGAGMLPQLNSSNRYDDLQENSIVVVGENDGKFDAADYILFYGKSQKDQWLFNKNNSRYTHVNNIYADTTYYFITFGGTAGKRINKQSSVPISNTQTSEFDYNMVHEQDRLNLIRSGRLWVGEEFDKVPQQDFSVSLGAINTDSQLFIRSATVARSVTQSQFSVSINGTPVITHTIPSITAYFEDPYAAEDGADPKTATLSVSSGNVTIGYSYNQPVSGAIGWLDYFELQSRNYLQMITSQLSFRDSKSVGSGKITQFTISNVSSPIRVWDLSNTLSPLELVVTVTGTTSSITTQTDSLKEFIAFDGKNYITPVYFGKVLNQNLHALSSIDYVIVSHPQFINESKQLASFYSDKMRVQVITTDQIYNEFSSGAQDLCAIRDFLRMLYTRATSLADKPKYLLLFGRASYDYKYRMPNNTNFVPTYESVESFSPVDSYNSDDFLGFLDDAEGRWDSPADIGTKLDFLDIGIGRLPAQNIKQAQIMLNKISAYKTSAAFGEWKNRMVFVADDEDNNVHINQADALANNARTNFKNYNIEKIYIDAFKEVEEAGGARYPDAQAAIVRSVERGAIAVNYTGHGGEVGWAAERILNTDNINGWTNGLKLPIFITATCEFSRFDDPELTSAGEMVLLNPYGGGIALFTTVRLVNAFSNATLNQYFYKYAGFDSASVYNRLNIGEIMMLTKNDYTSGDRNERNFTLLGDPAMMLAYPKNKIMTTAINATPISTLADTMKAFGKVSIDGVVTDINGVTITNYNGTIYPIVYDKATTYTTIGNNSGSYVKNFDMQNNALYRGKATVQNGVFHFSFIVPKDIAYQNGYGKLSYYAQNENSDANGFYTNFIVGGTSDSVPPDKTGPEIALFMNDEKFVNGGITNENPLFIAKLKDENGINTVGTGVGRDLLLTLTNKETNKSITVNDYYQAKLDTYQEGDVNYRFKQLPQGNNTVKLRALDIYNNISESSLDFVVSNSEEVALKHVLNFPNPFTNHTTFHFDHNKAGEAMTVSIQIFTVSGKLIKTLQAETSSATGHFDELSWDGKDDYGDAIGKGVYVYKVRIKSSLGKTAEEFQKLVILN